jgi:hypothetical protein
MGSFQDLTGQTFGRLTAQWPIGRSPQGAWWLCLCKCGNLHPVKISSLRNSETKSCGCLRIDLGRTAKLTHGYTKNGILTPEYRSWAAAKTRCTNVRSRQFPDYGGRGITFCARWRGSEGFVNFLTDMGVRPAGTSLDRINNDGNYEPGNCRWATNKQQVDNRRIRTIENFSDEVIAREFYRRKLYQKNGDSSAS